MRPGSRLLVLGSSPVGPTVLLADRSQTGPTQVAGAYHVDPTVVAGAY